MADGLVGSWRDRGFDAPVLSVRAEPDAALMPLVRFRGSALLQLRDKLLYMSAGEGLGTLRGRRYCEPEDSVVFDCVFSSDRAGYKFGDIRVWLDDDIHGHRRPQCGDLRSGGDGCLLHIYNSVAFLELMNDDLILRICLECTLPRFKLTAFAPLPALCSNANVANPALADVSLAVVLRGGVTARDGETIGFLIRSENEANTLVPVFVNDNIRRRAIVGSWALRKNDFWAASSLFVSKFAKTRNLKVNNIQRSPDHASAEVRGVGQRREVKFIVAQFHEHVGGPPDFVPCIASMPPMHEPQSVTFTAEITANTNDSELLKGLELNTRFISEQISPRRSIEKQLVDRSTKNDSIQIPVSSGFGTSVGASSMVHLREIHRDLEKLRSELRSLEIRGSLHHTSQLGHGSLSDSPADSLTRDDEMPRPRGARRAVGGLEIERNSDDLAVFDTGRDTVASAEASPETLRTEFVGPDTNFRSHEHSVTSVSPCALRSSVWTINVPSILADEDWDGKDSVPVGAADGSGPTSAKLDGLARQYLSADYISRLNNSP